MVTKRKSSTVTINSDNTLNNDSELFFAIGSSETWAFRYVVQGNSTTQADFQFAVTAPTGATCTVAVIDSQGATTVSNLACGSASGLIAGNGAADVYEIVGTVVNGSTSGDVTLQWAQSTSNTGNTTVYAGSYLTASATSSSGGLEFLQAGNSFGSTAVLGTNDNYGLNFETNGNNRLTISSTGSVSVLSDLTVGTGLSVTTGGLTVTGDSSITGALTNLTGLEVDSGGATIIGGLDLSDDGIVNAGSITGVGNDITANGALTIASGATGDLELSSSSGTIVLGASTMQRTASGETLIALNDTSDTTLRITNNDGSASAALIVEGGITANSFSGSGSGLTSLNASNISSGTVADARLSSNVGLLNLSNTFSERQIFSSGLTLGNSASSTAGTIRWTGSDFEGYDGSGWVSLTSGTGTGSGTSNVVTVIKSSNETVNNSSTLQDDNHLKFAIAGDEDWTFRFVVKANSGAVPNLKFAVTAPSGATCSTDVIDAEGAVTASNLGCGISSGTIAGNGTTDTYEVIGSIVNGSTAGDVTLQWSQDTANASDTTVYTGSYVNAVPASDISGTTSNAFVQGGNSFGAKAILGTSDAYGIDIVAGGSAALAIDSLGDATFNGDLVVASGLTSNGAVIMKDNVTLGDDSSDGLVIYGQNVTLQNGLNFDSGTLAIDSATNRVGIGNATPGNLLSINTPIISDSSAQVMIYTNGVNNEGLMIQNVAGQSASAFEIQNSNGQTMSAFDSLGQLVLGNDGSTPQAGLITFNDNTGSNGFTAVLGISTLSSNRAINLPNEAGTICLQNSANCGFLLFAQSSAQTDSTTNNSIFINKTGASGDIINLQKNGTTVFSILNTGALQQQITSTNAFTINNASGAQYFNVDTSGAIVRIGGATADDSGVLLVLDTKNTAGDPSGVDGAMYYNSADGKKRCYEGGVWTDCINLAISGETTLAAANATISISLNANYEYLQCRLDSKGSSSAGQVFLRFNSDTGAASYSWNTYNIVAAAVVDAQDNSDSEIQLNGTRQYLDFHFLPI